MSGAPGLRDTSGMSIPLARAAVARWSRWFNAAGAVAVLNLGRMLWFSDHGTLLHGGDVAFAVVVTVALASLLVAKGKARASLERLLAIEAAELAKLRTPRVPDAGPDQCPVCGGFGLDALAIDDEFMERGVDRAKVVPWGRKRAHWACAEFVPYESTKAGREAEALGIPAIAFEVDGHPTYTGPASVERALRLAKGATAGSRTILVDGAAPGTLFLLQGAALRHMEIVTIAVIGGGSRSGFGISVTLAAPLRHSFAKGTQLLPFSGAEQLWNREAGRPYTRTELGLCDCRPEGKLRASPNAPQGRPCSFTAHIHELPAEPRWAHACVCDDCMAVVVQSPTRSAVKAARPSWMSASEARVLADIEEARLAPCRPPRAVAEGRWLWPDSKALRRRP